MAASGAHRSTRKHVPSPGRGARAADVLHSMGGGVTAPEALTKEERSLGGASRRHFPRRAEAAAAADSKAGRAPIRQMPTEPRPVGSHGLSEDYWTSRRTERRRPERSHTAGPADGRGLDDSAALTRLLGTKGKPVLADGTVARFRPAIEESLELALTRRRKIDPADKMAQRNGIGMAKPGDNLVARADYTPGFFVGGAGAIPGSTSGLHKSYSPLPKAARRPADAPSATAVRGYGEESPPPSAPAGYGTLTLEQRRRAEALVADMEAIEALNPDDASSDEEGEGGAGAAAGGGGGSWEVTTGNFTVRPRPGVTGGGE